MPRPKQKSDRIQLRLPLPVANELAGDATANGISMGVQAERIIIAHYATRHPTPTADCRHARTRALSGGMKVCEACDQIRGLDGQWRARQ